jgi:predicted outer membrane repeat protein
VSGTITLASTLPRVTDPAGLSIDGGGDVTVSGKYTPGVSGVRVFEVGEGATLSLKNLTVSDGLAFDRGGGVYNGGGALAVEGSTFSRNLSDDNGGAIYNDEGGTLEVSGSTFSTNEGDFAGGGIENDSGTAQVTNSTFYANESGIGGGIDNGGVLTVTNSTFSGNSASESGGAIGGLAVTLRGTVLAESPFGGNCQRQPIDGGYNVSDDGTCGFDQATGSLPDTDPLLDPDGLQDNGGPTKTVALRPDSPAVDLVAEGACPPPPRSTP